MFYGSKWLITQNEKNLLRKKRFIKQGMKMIILQIGPL